MSVLGWSVTGFVTFAIGGAVLGLLITIAAVGDYAWLLGGPVAAGFALPCGLVGIVAARQCQRRAYVGAGATGVAGVLLICLIALALAPR